MSIYLCKTTRNHSHTELHMPSPLFSSRSTAFRITTQQITPQLSPQATPRKYSIYSKNNEPINEQSISQLKHKHRKAQTQVDSRVFWNKVNDFALYRNLQAKDNDSKNQAKARLYNRLQKIQKDNAEQLRLKEELEEKQLKAEKARCERLQQEMKAAKEKQMKLKQNKEILRMQFLKNRRFTFYNVVNAVILLQQHSKLGAFKLSKLLAKHYLNLLNYKGVLNRIKDATETPLVIDQGLESMTLAIQAAQIKEIQKKLNEGLIIKRVNTSVLLIKPQARKNRISYQGNQIFSERVLKRVRFLQSCFRLKVFKCTKKGFQKQKIMKQKSTVNRLRANQKVLTGMNFIKENSPKNSDDTEVVHKPPGALAIFSTIQKASLMFKNYHKHKSEKLLQTTNDYVVKRVQQLYYPTIRYVSVFYQTVVVWSIVYLDITSDKTCIVLYFKGEGRNNYFYRLDIPIGIITKPSNEDCITVWPTVKAYLISFLQLKGQLALLGEEQLANTTNYKLNFIQGLSMRSRRNVKSADIQNIVETKHILNYLQTQQIVRIRKLFGSIYKLLPQFKKQIENGVFINYIVNLPLIHQIILQIRLLDQDIRYQQRFAKEDLEKEKDRYYQYIRDKQELLNQILYFRFISNSTQFYQDQLLKTLYQKKGQSIYIQCAVVNIQDILNQYEERETTCLQKFALISMHLVCKADIQLDGLLFDVDSKQPAKAHRKVQQYLFKVDPLDLEWKFKLQQFHIQIQVYLFRGDQHQEDDDIIMEEYQHEMKIEPINVEIPDFEKVGRTLQETMQMHTDQQFNFHKLLKDILIDSKSHNQLFELVLLNAFSINFRTNQLIIKPKYTHILSKTHNFIQKMDHQSLYNKTDYVLRYSVFPGEEKILRRAQESSEGDTRQLAEVHHFNRLFSTINQLEVRLNEENKFIEQVTDYIQESNTDHQVEQTFKRFTLGLKPQFCFTNQECTYQYHYKKSLRIVTKRHYDEVSTFDVIDQGISQQIMKCAYLNKYKQATMLVGIMKRLVKPTSFLYRKFNSRVQMKRGIIPAYDVVKLMLISVVYVKQNQNVLKEYLDYLDFIFTVHLHNGKKCYVHAKIYYSTDSSTQKQQERVYQFDGEHLFGSLEIYEFSSKLKKYILVFNKYDLEDMFQIEKKFTFNADTVNQWCIKIVANTTFDRRFLYRVPFLQFNDAHQSQSSSPLREHKRPFNEQKCIYNQFHKTSFDSGLNEKRFLNQVHKVYRVVGHFVEKFYLVKQHSKHVLLSQAMFRQSKNVQIISLEYVIISVSAHIIFDIFQVIYYFPKSKRRLMTYINLLTFQEMDYKDCQILQLVNQTRFNSYKEVTQYVKSISKGSLLRKTAQLDGNVLSRIKFMRKPTEASPSGNAITPNQKPKKQDFATLTNNLFQKNHVIKSKIKQNEEICDLVLNFMKFTRQLNAENNGLVNSRFIEIKIWRLLMIQVFQLSLENDKQVKNQIHVYDRLVEPFADYKKNSIRIIGKEYLMKRQQVENAHFNYRVQLQLTKLYETVIQQHMIKFPSPFKCIKTKYQVQTNYFDQPIMEFICLIQFKVERMGAAYVECFIECLIKKNKVNLFKPMELIEYSNSSNFNIYFRYYSLNNYNFKDIRLNLRELLNLFIADGFFKSQTNYMNSKLSLADIRIMCHYLTYKIRSQNFLNLPQIALIKEEVENPLENHIIMECNDNQLPISVLNTGEGYVYSETVKHAKVCVIIQLQLFPTQKKVIYNRFDVNHKHFGQKDLTFADVAMIVPYFRHLIKAQRYYSALKRLAQQLRVKYKN